MAGIVLNHTAGEQNFTYTTDTCGGRDCPAERHPGDSKGRYFIEFCPQVLDDWGEWSYDTTLSDYGGASGTYRGGTLLLKAPAPGLDPNDVDVFGKRVTYAVVTKQCEDVAVEGLTFFGATMFDWRSKRTAVRSNRFEYPSFSKRALLDVTPDRNPSDLGPGEPADAGGWYDGSTAHFMW